MANVAVSAAAGTITDKMKKKAKDTATNKYADYKKNSAKDKRSFTEKTQDRSSSILGNRPKYWEPRTVAGYRRILTAEFLTCIIIVSYRGWKNREDGSLTNVSGNSVWRQLGAVWIAFFILAILSSISWKIARICALLGGLITMVVLLKESEVITSIADLVKNSFGTTAPGQDAPTLPTPTTDNPTQSGLTHGSAGGGSSGGGAASW